MTVRVVTPANVQSVLNGAVAGDDINFQGTATFPAFEVPKRLNLHGNGTAKVVGTGYPIKVKSAAAGSLIEGFASIGGSTGKDLACVLIERAHDVTIEGNTIENGAQYGIRVFEANGSKILGNAIRKVGAGIMFTRNGAGAIVRGNEIGPIDKMITDNGTAATNGGDGIQLIDNDAGILIEDNDFNSNRAKTVGGSSWKYDGGATTGYGKCGAVTFRNNRIRDCVNVMEMGTDASKGGVPTGWVIEDNEAWGNADVAPDESRSCVGFFLRANNSFVIRRNKLHELDDFFLRLDGTSGQYAGSMVGNSVSDNDIWVKPGNSDTYGKNRAYVVTGVNPANWGKIEGNRVYFDAAVSPEVAEKDGSKTRLLAQWKTWTGWGTGETWGPATPVDPCAAVKAERDAAIVQRDAANAQVTSLTAAVAAERAKLEAAKQNALETLAL